jgi:hypothetical protein
MNEFQPLNDDEVLYVNMGRVLMSNPTFKVGEFLDALAQAISDREEEWSDDKEDWFSDGLPCEALRFSSQGWQRGKVRIRLEFAPDMGPRAILPEARASSSRRLEKPNPREDDIYRPDRDSFYRSERNRPERDDIYRGPDDF